MDDTKSYPEYLGSPRRELSNGDLGIVVVLLVRPGTNFSCVSTWCPIQLYPEARNPKSEFQTKKDHSMQPDCNFRAVKQAHFLAEYHIRSLWVV